MRCLSARSKLVPTESAFEDGIGAALYVGPPDVDDPSRINYANQRTLVGDVVPLGDWPGEYLQHDAAVAVVKAPTAEIGWTVPDEYLGTTFWVNVRPHEDGLELDSISGPQRVTVNSGGDPVETIGGTGYVIDVIKLDGGGVRVDVEWYVGTTGTTPTELALEATAGPTSPSVAVPWSARSVRYSLEIADLDADADYEFDVIARHAAAAVTFGTVSVTTDGTGPEAATSLTAEVES